MIPCPNCGHEHSTVRESRNEPGYVRRYRVCKNCGKSFPTEEYLAVYAGQARGMILDRPVGFDQPDESGGDG